VPHQLILPGALLSLFGAAFGVYLGNSAINEINPAYYDADQPSSRFYADLSSNPPRDWAVVQVRELHRAEQGLPIHPTCIGCRTYPEEYYPVHDASLGKPQIGWAEVEDTSPEVQAAVVQEAPEFASVERYTEFPVSQEEAAEGPQVELAAQTGGFTDQTGTE
jgi:hypothetical protein